MYMTISAMYTLSFGGSFASLLAEFIPNSKFTILGALLGVVLYIVTLIGLYIRIMYFKSKVLHQLDIAKGDLPCFENFDANMFDVAAQMMTDPKKRDLVYQIGVSRLKNCARIRAFYCMYLLEKDQNQRHKIKELVHSMNNLTTYEIDTSFFKYYCVMKRKELEMTLNQGNKHIVLQLERAKQCKNKIKHLLAELWRRVSEEQSISNFPNIISSIEEEERKCKKILDYALKLDPNHVGTVRAYAVFESEIKRNYYKAEELFADADSLEEKNFKIVRKSGVKKFSTYLQQAIGLKEEQKYTYEVEEQTPPETPVNSDLDEEVPPQKKTKSQTII